MFFIIITQNILVYYTINQKFTLIKALTKSKRNNLLAFFNIISILYDMRVLVKHKTKEIVD